MQKNRKFIITAAWIALLHALGLAALSLFRTAQYIALHDMAGDTGASVLTAFVKGLWFDNVTMCYVSVLPLFTALMAASFDRTSAALHRAVTWWYGIMCAIVFMASAANIPYFEYFFRNINSSIFEWFGYAGTTAGMVTGEASYIIYILLYAALTAAFAYAATLARRRCDRLTCGGKADRMGRKLVAARLMATLALTGLCVFGIRGRTGYNPIKVSQAYYCNDPFLNQLGINPMFNLLTSALDDMRKENRQLHLADDRLAVAQARHSLHITGPCDSIHPLRRQVNGAYPPPRRHNVVVIMMESMSARLMDSFGNGQHLTPTLDSLYNCGATMAFDRCYSAGIHTNHGMTATLYSFPALMFRNLMKGTVTPKREGLPTVLHAMGYHNMFFMPHEAQYDNMKAFFTTNGYDEIFSQENYPADEVVNAFGVPDHFLLDYGLRTISDRAKSGVPFLATILTVSNHPPYRVPAFFKPKSDAPETQIVEYADWALGRFLAQARQQPWHDNTIYVIVADHGKIVGKVGGELPESYNHIPLVICGPGVPQGRTSALAQQVDIMPTLLSLLGASYSYEGFGVDLTKEKRDMVFYSADSHIVARDSARCLVYNNKTQASFLYDTQGGTDRPTRKNGTPYDRLRDYAFAMTQTAQFILDRQK